MYLSQFTFNLNIFLGQEELKALEESEKQDADGEDSSPQQDSGLEESETSVHNSIRVSIICNNYFLNNIFIINLLSSQSQSQATLIDQCLTK